MIGQLLKVWRVLNKLGVREAAIILKLSSSTISRIENGKPMDQETMVLLINWLFQKGIS